MCGGKVLQQGDDGAQPGGLLRTRVRRGVAQARGVPQRGRAHATRAREGASEGERAWAPTPAATFAAGDGSDTAPTAAADDAAFAAAAAATTAAAAAATSFTSPGVTPPMTNTITVP